MYHQGKINIAGWHRDVCGARFVDLSERTRENCNEGLFVQMVNVDVQQPSA